MAGSKHFFNQRNTNRRFLSRPHPRRRRRRRHRRRRRRRRWRPHKRRRRRIRQHHPPPLPPPPNPPPRCVCVPGRGEPPQCAGTPVYPRLENNYFLKKCPEFFFEKNLFTFRELLAPGQCPHGYHKFHNKCYKLWPEKVTFQEAIRTCK